jgi:predicted ATPase
MRVIDKVEISYYRSVYSATLNRLSDLNILFGNNDSGKSNVLKALNLFFNNESELGYPYYFFDDMSRVRESEAKQAKGRASIWIKVTFNNYKNWSSLPSTFTIKKSWNRYSDQPDVKVQSAEDIPDTTLGRFLNGIRFHYVPAIRGRDIFQYYLSLLHDSLMEDEKLSILSSSGGMMKQIDGGLAELSEKIMENLSIDSKIEAPTNLRQLFSALDFSTAYSGHDIPLQKRGDGVQARHIPFILDVISKSTRQTHIWAYEEPENSLEMGRSFEMAGQFHKGFSKDKQIFISTHSPAFYSLDGDSVTKWKVYQDYRENESGIQSISSVSTLGSSESADQDAGMAALIASRTKDLHRKLKRIEDINADLREQVGRYEKPVLIVEGETDRDILYVAYQKLYGDEPYFDILPGENTEGVARFCRNIDKMPRDNYSKIVGLVDNDHAGKDAMKKERIDSLSYSDGSVFKKINADREIYFGMLPESESARRAKGNLSSDGKNFVGIPIEFLLYEDFVNSAIEEGALVLDEVKGTFSTHAGTAPYTQSQLFGDLVDEDVSYFLYKPSGQTKRNFVDYINEYAGKEDFVYFEELFESIDQLFD